MRPKSGGSRNKMKTAADAPSSSLSSQPTRFQQDAVDKEGENGFVPLESRFIEIRDSNGTITQVPALDKRWAPGLKYIEFYLPSCKTLAEDEAGLLTWLDYMDMYATDLKWLLSVPHHQFWSVMVHSPQVSHLVLHSFLLRSPQWFDKEFEIYLAHQVIGPKYQQIYSLVFRVFLRLCTYKESKKDFISPITWASLLADNQILDVLKLQSLCCIYDSETNSLLPKMIENVMKHCPKLAGCFRNLIPALLSTSEEMTEELHKRIEESVSTNVWKVETYDELLSFFLNTTCGLYKFCKVYTPAAEIVMKFNNALIQLALTYEPNCCKLWGQVIAHLPSLEERVKVLRILLIRLFRVALANPTIKQVTSSNDHRIDEYFEVLTNCLDEKTFIRDYEKAYPFKQDINALLSRGVFIDETRIDYIANAISACFNACGEDYAVEKIVVDPLYDPNFDRQLLGACSLDVSGVELQSLVTQVKDILPELPDSYVEAVLKHYGYQAEVAINALLEGSVPTRLEKYKNENYVQPLTSNSVVPHNPFATEDTELEKLASKLVLQDVSLDGEKFYAGKRRYGFDSKNSVTIDKSDSDWLPSKTHELVEKMNEEAATRATNEQMEAHRRENGVRSAKESVRQLENQERYIDESLLPSFRNSLEYEDEYDDTYDELGVGMTEPDNIECKPLNQKKQSAYDANDEEEEEQSSSKDNRLDFCEDPAIVRARLERRREEKYQHNHRRGGGGPPPQPADVVGRAKGQGQEKDVVYARRQKNINKDPGGNKKKRADFKRREF